MKRKDILISLSIILISIIVATYVHSYLSKKIDSINLRIKDEQRKNEVLKELEGLYTDIGKESKFSFAKDTSEALGKISEIFQKFNISTEYLRPQLSTFSEGVDKIYIRTNFYTDFNNLKNLLHYLSGLKEIIVIDRLDIEKTDEGLRVNLTIYCLKSNVV